MKVFADEEAKREIFSNPIGYESFGQLVTGLVDGLTTILIPFLVLAVAVLGFRMVFALYDGDSAVYGKLKERLIWTFIGLFLVLGAKGILLVIKNTVGNVLTSM